MLLRPSSSKFPAAVAAARPTLLPRHTARTFASAENPPPSSGSGSESGKPQPGSGNPPPQPPLPGNPYGKNLEKQLTAKKDEMRSQLESGRDYLKSLWAERRSGQAGAGVEVDSEW